MGDGTGVREYVILPGSEKYGGGETHLEGEEHGGAEEDEAVAAVRDRASAPVARP